jgi:hypothetical protein
VGAIQHELFKDGLGSAIAIDASSSYLQAVRQEAERMGYAARITYHHGDFVACNCSPLFLKIQTSQILA